MSYVLAKRISGNYWERLVYVALPLPLICIGFILYRNGFAASTGEPVLIFAMLAFLAWVVDCEPARRRNPVELVDGNVLLIGNDAVPTTAIQSLTPLRRYRTLITNLIELTYQMGDETRTVNVLSKPDIFPLGLILRPRSLRLMLKSHPELKDRVRQTRVI